MHDPSLWVTVLAGGIGSRFWPVSTPERPKQLLALGSDRPLIVDTVERARAIVADDRIRILAGRRLADAFRTVLPGLPDVGYWIEPQARGTAPVLAWAAWKLARLDPEAVMVSLHADHLIRPLQAFQEAVATAAEIARRDGLLVCLGVRPDRVETGYGHVELAGALPAAGRAEAYRVATFHEKPAPPQAQRYMDEGCLWNTGIFVWRAKSLVREVEEHAPELSACFPLIEESDEAFFEAAPVGVIDRVVMERTERAAVVHASFHWDDVGSWEALSRTRPGDERGNVLVGPARAVDAKDNIVFAEGGEVVLFGTSGLVVVRTADTTVVMPRSRAPDLKSLIARLEDTRS